MSCRRSILPIVGLLAILAGCGSSGSGGGSPSVQASAALTAGLKAQQAGRLSDARTLYERVISLQPGNAYAHFDLGVIAEHQSQTVLALSDYGAALTINPNFAPALFNEAIIYTPTNPQLAISLYRQVLKLKPTDAGTALNLGLLEAGHGQITAAQHDLQLAIREDPSLTKRIPAKTAAEAKITAGPSSAPTTTPTASP